jgi:hypothetical protein
MGTRPKTGPRQVAGQKHKKPSSGKSKAKPSKAKTKELSKKPVVPSVQEISEKTLASISNLGSQVFALSPFNQYFDDWLVNLRQTIAGFESNPTVKVDEPFIKQREQIFADVEAELAKKRIEESKLQDLAKNLADTNHSLVEIDSNYAAQTRELGTKRNSDIERATKAVHDLEQELEKVKQMKTRFFGFTKKAKAKKEEEVLKRLDLAKSELEVIVDNFKVEQEKLHDEYEEKKQATIAKVQSLEKEIVNIETDASVSIRQSAGNALSNAVKELLQRTSTSQ